MRIPSRPVAILLSLQLLAVPLLSQAQKGKPAAGPRRPAASASAVAAAPSPEEQLRTRKQQGDEAMVALRYSDALAAYREVFATTGEAALLYNMARAFQGLERFPEALDHFEQFKAKDSPELLAKVATLDELVEQVRGRVSSLSIVAEQPGARVVLRDAEIGRTPVTRTFRVNAGKARLEVLLDGHYPFERELQLDPGQTTVVKVVLLARDRSGLLVVKARPEGTELSIDGAARGMTPFETPLDAGSHRLDLQRAGFDPLSTQVFIEAGARKELELELSATAPITSRWWFWTGIGVAVVGGASLIYALSTERSATKGTIAPGQIRNTLIRF
jgi:hypothetical protein